MDRILSTLSRQQLAHWIAFLELEPPAADRLDVLLPKLFADLINAGRINPDAEPVTCDDLRIDWEADPEPEPADGDYAAQTAAKEAEMMATIMTHFSGT